ncbi:substrate-binding domain-containing protein [Devosia ginsengisoli]|uniref:substrate-binding domain-containing protein n=1 Tax=Devosia ginsengisoli TaxID=400770 RepID=UPI0026F1EAD6|nr:substrate-binding domain-containing protein [Devosia ginsengisoli]MCR6671395.1 substrate-binding domain-containing protein [Devosia ginsengisoli]
MTTFARLLGSTVLAASLSAAAFAGAATAQDKLIVNINKSGTQQYFIDQGDGFTAAAEELGYQASVINVELDANLAISAMTDAIAAGAKGIAITVPDQAIGPAVATAAADAGILLVGTNDNIADAAGNPIPLVGFDGKDMGTKVGIAAGELLNESDWLSGGTYGILSVEVQTLSVCNDRTDASRSEITKAGADAARIFPVTYDGTTNSALEAAGPVVTAHPDVDKWVVFGCNDEGVLGTLNALTNAGFAPDDIIAVGLGAYEACRPWAAGQPSGFKAALYISGTDVGAAAAKVLIAALEDGAELPANTVADTSIVTPENYQDHMPCT